MVLTAQVGYFSSYREFSRPLSHGGKEPKWQSYFDTFRAQKVKISLFGGQISASVGKILTIWRRINPLLGEMRPHWSLYL